MQFDYLSQISADGVEPPTRHIFTRCRPHTLPDMGGRIEGFAACIGTYPVGHVRLNMSSMVDSVRASVAVAIALVVVTACASNDSALTICEAAALPVGTKVAISASYKQGDLFGMAGGFCGDEKDPDVNPLLTVQLVDPSITIQDHVERGDWVVIRGILAERVVEGPEDVPWLILINAVLDILIDTTTRP